MHLKLQFFIRHLRTSRSTLSTKSMAPTPLPKFTILPKLMPLAKLTILPPFTPLAKLPTLIIFMILMSACGGSLISQSMTSATPTPTPVPGGAEPAVRFIFSQNNFTDLPNFLTGQNTPHTCLGDVLKNYEVIGPDYTGTPVSFPLDTSVGDQLVPTTRPTFVKNVSVDMTNTYFALTQSGSVQTDHCSLRGMHDDPGPSACASFDATPPAAPAPTIVPVPTATPTATPTPSITPNPTPTPATTAYYNTNYYHTRDDFCTGQGPVQSADPETSKSGVGGINIDLDRSQLGATEDLVMMVTYHSLNANASWPGPQLANDTTILQVNLVGTGQTLASLIGITQPRSWAYANFTQYPIYLKQIATLEDPFGSLRTEQVYLPISQNGLIDRIRIDRVRGSYHLFQIDLYRLGNRQ